MQGNQTGLKPKYQKRILFFILKGGGGGVQSQNYHYFNLLHYFYNFWNIVSWYDYKVKRAPFFLVRGKGNLKITIIFIHRSIYMKFDMLFPNIISRWFNWVETIQYQKGGCFFLVMVWSGEISKLFLFTIQFFLNL